MTVNRALIAYALAVVMARTAPTTPATETHRLKNRADDCPKPTRIDHGRHDEPWRRKNHIGKARR